MCARAKLLQLCLTLSNPMDSSLPGSSVHGIFQARILESASTHTHRHTHTQEYYSVVKKNEIIPSAATWIDLEIIILSEVSQTEKDKYYMISLKSTIKYKVIYKTEIVS